jgi:hypothetical protein
MRVACGLFLAVLAAFSTSHVVVGRADNDEIVTAHKSFRIPMPVPMAIRDEVKEKHLYVSKNKGKTWQLVERVGPAEETFSCKVTEDGLYWFQGQLLMKDGSLHPKEVASPDSIKVRVDSNHQAAPRPAAVLALQQEIKRLQDRVDILEKRLAEVEARDKKRK